MSEQEKYQLSPLETENLTKIKMGDIKTIIRLADNVCKQVYDKQKIKFDSGDFEIKLNPVTGIRRLQRAIDFCLDHYEAKNKHGERYTTWEDNDYEAHDGSGIEHKSNSIFGDRERELKNLHTILSDVRLALANSYSHARDGEFRDEYDKHEKVHAKNLKELGQFANHSKMDKNSEAIENGKIVPRFDSNELDFYFTDIFVDKNGNTRSLNNVEFYKEKFGDSFDIEEEKQIMQNWNRELFFTKEEERNISNSWYAGFDFQKMR